LGISGGGGIGDDLGGNVGGSMATKRGIDDLGVEAGAKNVNHYVTLSCSYHKIENFIRILSTNNLIRLFIQRVMILLTFVGVVTQLNQRTCSFEIVVILLIL